MCECADQLNQVMDKLRAMEIQIGDVKDRLTAVDDNTAEIHEFVTEMNKVMEQFKGMFSEDNLMAMLGGFMGGGIPAIGG